MQQQAFVDLEEFLGGARQISISKYVLLNKIVLDRMNTSCKYPKVAKYQRISITENSLEELARHGNSFREC